jgi:GDPmannose 4,6-dehydratase
MSKTKTALILGVSGQDGYFLTELLLNKGYFIYGLSRFITSNNIASNFRSSLSCKFENCDINNIVLLKKIIQTYQPDEIYNLASQSSPGASWDNIYDTQMINGYGALNIFEISKIFSPKSKIYQPSSSDMFGNTFESPQNEKTVFNPMNPYSISKLFAHRIANIYRNKYSLFISTGILYNHESYKRPLHFLAQKVSYGAACAFLNIENSPDLNEIGKPIVENGILSLGNLEIYRDWGHAKDFVYSMWLSLQHKTPDDYVIGTGILHSLSELCNIAYGSVNIDWKTKIQSDSDLIRPLDVLKSVADNTKAYIELGWYPKITFEEMIVDMVKYNIVRLSR